MPACHIASLRSPSRYQSGPFGGTSHVAETLELGFVSHPRLLVPWVVCTTQYLRSFSAPGQRFGLMRTTSPISRPPPQRSSPFVRHVRGLGLARAADQGGRSIGTRDTSTTWSRASRGTQPARDAGCPPPCCLRARLRRTSSRPPAPPCRRSTRAER